VSTQVSCGGRGLGCLWVLVTVRLNKSGTTLHHMKKDMGWQAVFELCLPTEFPTGLASLVSCPWLSERELQLPCYVCLRFSVFRLQWPMLLTIFVCPSVCLCSTGLIWINFVYSCFLWERNARHCQAVGYYSVLETCTKILCHYVKFNLVTVSF
jgi:hypothetical protein